tara:strand:- start:1381 stop:2112 length:732 start_codon:yes stop_codon:yes gene_type:complete
MKKIIILLAGIILASCANDSKKTEKIDKKQSKKIEKAEKVEDIKKFEIIFDKTKISKFTIENVENTSSKAMIKKLSEYSTSELTNLPSTKRQVIRITIPTEISKENLENTLKYIVAKKTEENNDIDEIIIFAYDSKSDINSFYTFAKLLWAPNGKLGDVTPKIASNNIRDNYKFIIDIKDKVGNISKSDIPTKRELQIYTMIMDDKYLDYPEEKLNELVMKKFNIKSTKELEEIWLKVAAYKN